MTEKERIELTTAAGFLRLYNSHFETDYAVVEHADAPDLRCRDARGRVLNLEITATEDRPRDIQALLGRSNHKSIEALAEHSRQVRKGKDKPQVNCLWGNALDQLVARAQNKARRSYGANTALVIRDTSGVDWDWGDVLPNIRERIGTSTKQFDGGIWILNLSKTKLYRVNGSSLYHCTQSDACTSRRLSMR